MVKKLIVDGEVYCGIRDLAQSKNIAYPGLAKWVRLNGKSEFSMQEYRERLKTGEYGARKLVIDGQEYRSIKEAADKLGLVYNTLVKWTGNTARTIFSLEEFENRAQWHRVVIDGKPYRSLMQAEKETGMSQWRIRHFIRKTGKRDFTRKEFEELPRTKPRKFYWVDGKDYTVEELIKITGFSYSSVYYRLGCRKEPYTMEEFKKSFKRGWKKGRKRKKDKDNG